LRRAVVTPAPFAQVCRLIRFRPKSVLFARRNPIADFFGGEEAVAVAAKMGELLGAEAQRLGRHVGLQVPGKRFRSAGNKGNFPRSFLKLSIRSKLCAHQKYGHCDGFDASRQVLERWNDGVTAWWSVGGVGVPKSGTQVERLLTKPGSARVLTG